MASRVKPWLVDDGLWALVEPLLPRRERRFRLEFPRFCGHLSAWSVLSGQAGRMARYAEGIESSEAVSGGVPA